jgi:hypothetical protein
MLPGAMPPYSMEIWVKKMRFLIEKTGLNSGLDSKKTDFQLKAKEETNFRQELLAPD